MDRCNAAHSLHVYVAKLRSALAAEHVALTIIVVVGALFGLIALMDGVVEGSTRAFDTAILKVFRISTNLAEPIGPPWLPDMVRDLTSLGSTAVLTLITVGAIGYLLIDRKPGVALFVLVAIGGGTTVSSILKIGVQRTRPDLVPALVHENSPSFPSGHAMLSTVTYLTIGVILARVQSSRRMKIYILTAAAVVALIVGVSRVYLGVHWPTDVLAGWCAGAAWALFCWLIALWLQRRGQIEAESTQRNPIEN
jgi:undecaprenyl-diphosphatase